MLGQSHHRIHALPLSLSDFKAFHYCPVPSGAKETTNHSSAHVPAPQTPKALNKVDAKWKDRQVVDVAIELQSMFEASIENEYNHAMSSKNKSMARINMSHRIAIAVNDDPSSKKTLSAIGLSKDSTQDDCIHGMNIAPSSLVHYCHVMQWDVLHVRGCVYYKTGPHDADDADDEAADDEAADDDGEANDHHKPPAIRRTHAIYYDSNTLVRDVDPTDVYNKYIPLNNIKKPLHSIHAYKLADLNKLKTKLDAWRVDNNQQKLSTGARKKEIYDALSSNIPHF